MFNESYQLSIFVNDKRVWPEKGVFGACNNIMNLNLNLKRVRLKLNLILIVLVSFSFGTIINAQEFRSIDGFGNNQSNPELGASGAELLRVTDVAYGDGISSLAGQDRPNPRTISNMMFDQEESLFDQFNLSDFNWAFGQFVDHDVTSVSTSHQENASVKVPEGDRFFAENSNILMFRSMAVPGSGTSLNNPRQHFNNITAYIDASSVYGSDEERATWLRSFSGGKLKTSKGNLLPWNTVTGEFNTTPDPSAPHMEDDTRSGSKLFVAGDSRANENPLLIAMHTIFVREHNRLAEEFAITNPDWDDELLYQMARKHVGAYLQNIVYNEWLNTQGVELPAYSGYNGQMGVGIFNVFSAAAFRQGHTLINSNIVRMKGDGQDINDGGIMLRDAFFNPTVILLAGGIEPYFQGMATQAQQALDCKLIDDLRNFLFGPPGTGGGLDLAAININRGRERGIPDFNTVRSNFGLPRATNFRDITGDAESAAILETIYGSVDRIDSWVGMLAEDPMPDALFGETIMAIMKRQFQLLRDGDRFYFENDDSLTEEEKNTIRNTSFRDLIMRNSGIEVMQDNVFRAMPYDQIPLGPELPNVQLASIAYPNPTFSDFTVKIYSDVTTDVDVSIFDVSGNLVQTNSSQLIPGDNYLTYSLGDSYSKGIFNVVIDAGYAYKIVRLFKEDN